MYVRKIAAAAGFACGAALALAPLAAADVTPVVDTEIAAQNQLFDIYAALSGDTVTHAATAGGYDSVPLSDVPQVLPGVGTYGDVTQLETYLYGANPILAGISSDSGPYSEFNGALTQFDNAYNVMLYAAENNGMLDTNTADYIENNALNHALTLGSPTAAAEYLYNFGIGDLKGYDAIFAPASTTVAPTDIDPTISNEIVQLNNLFELDGKLAGVFNDITPNINSIPGNYVGFDTISPEATTTNFNDLVFGLNPDNVSGDPGSYDVFNGALSEFFNASNVELYSLLNGGAILPVADVIGGHADFLSGGVTSAVTDFLQLGLADLSGYFDAGSLLGGL